MSSKKRSARDRISRLGMKKIPSDVTAEAVLQFYEALDCGKSLAAALLFKYGEYEQLLDLTAVPEHYENSEQFRDAYLSVNFLSKSKFLKTSWNLKDRAIEKFNTFEDRCRKTNWFFKRQFGWGQDNPIFVELLSATQHKIADVLGPFDPLELFDLASWGPGVSTLVKGEETFGAKKFQYETGMTRDLTPLASLISDAYPGWGALLTSKGAIHYEKGNYVVTVPKTSKIDRVIAIEPGLNLWFQLGVGRMIERRLARFGVDLSDQTRNQQLALEASKSGLLTTVDFSSASDSISSSVVEILFSNTFRDTNSQCWFDVMDMVRSKYGNIDSKVLKWEKFSSMGNGFTFPLETLIFYAAAISCCKQLGVSTSQISVYGDDVIIPSVCYELFSEFCDFLGFIVNPKKSFSSGCFRESCGSHFYSGVDCKPVYLEDSLTFPQRVFNFANNLRLRSRILDFGCDLRFRKLFYWLHSIIPKEIRFKVSASINASTQSIEPTEGGFISNFDESCPSLLRHGIEGFRVKRLAWVAVKREVDYDGLLLARLSSKTVESGETSMFPRGARTVASRWPSLDSLAYGNEVPLRGRVGCRLTEGHFRRWVDLGPWI